MKKYLLSIGFLNLLFVSLCFNYPGNKILYLIFSNLSFLHIYLSFKKESFFIEKFLSIFFFLGFWFKLSFELNFRVWSPVIMFREGVGSFDHLPSSYDEVVIVISTGLLAFICSHFSKKIYLGNNHFTSSSIKNYFYENFKKYIIMIYLLVLVTFGYFNSKYLIYQKGHIPNQDINVLISYAFRWFWVVGFGSLTAIFLNFEIKSKKLKILNMFLLLLEIFITNLSILCRAMIFNLIFIVIGAGYLLKYFKKMKILKEINIL